MAVKPNKAAKKNRQERISVFRMMLSLYFFCPAASFTIQQRVFVSRDRILQSAHPYPKLPLNFNMFPGPE